MLQPGDAAPAFKLPLDDGSVLDSATLAGAPYVVYFYPRDNTPGCTQEACDFRDNWARVTALGVRVFGVSTDTVASHAKFRAKFELPFPLVADTERALHAAYGAWGVKKMYGRESEGTVRSTFIIDATGRVRAAWPSVKVKGHVDEVLRALEA
jgi:peroxiredoxin Q/BCP